MRIFKRGDEEKIEVEEGVEGKVEGGIEKGVEERIEVKISNIQMKWWSASKHDVNSRILERYKSEISSDEIKLPDIRWLVKTLKCSIYFC